MSLKKLFGTGLILILVLGIYLQLNGSEVKNYKSKYENFPDLNKEVEGIEREGTYRSYLKQYEEVSLGKENIDIEVTDVFSGLEVEVQDFQSKDYEGSVLYCGDRSVVEWKVNLKEEGLYRIAMEYFPLGNQGGKIERSVLINGKTPFIGADQLSFSQIWINEGEVKRDNQGNDLRPKQVTFSKWMKGYLQDDLGYESEPYLFYFQQGENTIRFEGVHQEILMKKLTLEMDQNQSDYQEYQEKAQETILEKNIISELSDEYLQVIQGEEAQRRSSPSLYATYDRSAPNTVPYSVADIRLNMIGGNAWRIPGQWIEWDFEVPESGMYHITLKSRQNYNRGFVSNRTLRIDEEIPFSEMAAIPFTYSNNWEMRTLSDASNEAYDFYLEKGKHSLQLEVTLGEMGNLLAQMEDSVYRLNTIYRKILVLTGTTPDEFRDYKIEQVYPEVIEGMELESLRLYKLVDDIVAYSGQKASQVASAQTLAEQLEEFVENPYKIPKTLSNFKDNISALGTSILTLSEAPLDIDAITISGKDVKVDSEKVTFMDKAVHELRSFVASFTEDYNAVGNVYEEEETVEVWILSGRDQSSILKSMIDDSFTPETQIPVNLKLVDGATLLNAIIAGTAPDVVITAGQGDPVNFALRGAVEDLSQFTDLDRVLEDFYPSAYEPYRFEGGIYALPETQNYNVLFYRKDILEELGVEVPNTWEDLITMLPTIQQENMSVAIPSTERVIGNVSMPDLSSFLALIYQNGGQIYSEDSMSTLIDNESGVEAFEMYTKLFNQYSLPTVYDFVNRFRSGEMPLGIQDYGVYNTLVVFAPEIRGLWDFTLIPGTLQDDGSIDRSCHSSGNCTYMLKQSEDRLKEDAWEFMKWWVSADSQVRFGQEMESVMGAAARYATANTEAFLQLSWSHEQIQVLSEQWKWTVGLREIAGGYYTQRHITNAIRKVINEKEDSREVLLDYVTVINEEIRKKRLEFGLEVR